MGSSGLGSTSSQLYSGGGGGDDDFNLVLREVATAGSHVKKGDVVAEFDRQYMLQRLDDFKDAVTQNAASLKSQTANIQAQTAAHDQLVASAKADVEKAEFDMKTIPVLSRIDAERTKMALEQARAHYKQLVSETQFVKASNAALLKQSQLALAQSKLELEDAQRNVDKMLVSAPMDGTVVMESMWRSGDRGQIKKGDQLRAGMRYMRIVDPTQMLISAVVNQADVALLRVGQKARVRFDAYPGLVLDAHIDSIPPATNSAFFRADYVRTVPVRLRLDESDSRIIPDLSVGIDVDVAQVPDALTVERAAIFTSSDGTGESEPHVFVQNGAAWVRRRVRLGLENNISAVILEGLQPGDVVALDAPRELRKRHRNDGRMSKDLKTSKRLGQAAVSKKKRIYWGSAAAIALIAASVYGYTRYTASTKVEIPVAKVRRGDFIVSVKTRGEVRSVHSEFITAPQVPSPRIVRLAQSGKAIKKGDVVVEFDGAQLQQDYLEKVTNVRTADSEIAQTKAEHSITNEGDAMNLMDSGFNVQRAELEASKAEVISAIEGAKNKIDVGVAKGNLKQTNTTIDSHKTMQAADMQRLGEKKGKTVRDEKRWKGYLGEMVLRAPQDGIVNILPNWRSQGSFGSSPPPFKEGDNAWTGAEIAEIPDLS